jgi:hypothetical protein
MRDHVTFPGLGGSTNIEHSSVLSRITLEGSINHLRVMGWKIGSVMIGSVLHTLIEALVINVLAFKTQQSSTD